MLHIIIIPLLKLLTTRFNSIFILLINDNLLCWILFPPPLSLFLFSLTVLLSVEIEKRSQSSVKLSSNGTKAVSHSGQHSFGAGVETENASQCSVNGRRRHRQQATEALYLEQILTFLHVLPAMDSQATLLTTLTETGIKPASAVRVKQSWSGNN